MAWNWWTRQKRRIKRFRIHEDFQHITAVESRRRAWTLWWALALGLTLAAWALFAPLDRSGRELAWTVFGVVIGLPLVFSFAVISLNHLIRVDRRDRTVVHARRFLILPYHVRRFEMNAGYLRPTETVVSEKIPTESNASTALGCLGLIFGPLGLLLMIAQAVGSSKNHTLQWIHIPTLEWMQLNGEPAVSLLLVEDHSELERLLQTFEGKFPDAVQADPR